MSVVPWNLCLNTEAGMQANKGKRYGSIRVSSILAWVAWKADKTSPRKTGPVCNSIIILRSRVAYPLLASVWQIGTLEQDMCCHALLIHMFRSLIETVHGSISHQSSQHYAALIAKTNSFLSLVCVCIVELTIAYISDTCLCVGNIKKEMKATPCSFCHIIYPYVWSEACLEWSLLSSVLGCLLSEGTG